MQLYIPYQRNQYIKIFYLIIFFLVIFDTINVCGLQKTNFIFNINENFFPSAFTIK